VDHNSSINKFKRHTKKQWPSKKQKELNSSLAKCGEWKNKGNLGNLEDKDHLGMIDLQALEVM